MALRDELDRITAERLRREAQIISDEEVYRILINAMYEKCIVERIKLAVSCGKTKIKDSFPLSFFTESYNVAPPERLSGDSPVYRILNGYEESDRCGFRELYICMNGFFVTHVKMTPLGERVYQDLKRLAQKDQVSLSEPIRHITPTPHGNNGSLYVEFQYRYK